MVMSAQQPDSIIPVQQVNAVTVLGDLREPQEQPQDIQCLPRMGMLTSSMYPTYALPAAAPPMFRHAVGTLPSFTELINRCMATNPHVIALLQSK